MIKFTIRGNEIPVTNVHIIQDLSYYYSVIEFSSMAQLSPSDEVIMSDKTDQKLIILSGRFAGRTFDYVAVSEQQYKLLQTICSPFNKTASLREMLNELGIPAIIDQDTAKSNWCFGQQSVLSLLELLNKAVVPKQGQAPRVFMDIEGNIRYVPLTYLYEGSTTELKGKVTSDVQDTEWLVNTPGVIDVLSSNCEQISVETLEFTDAVQRRVLNATEFAEGAADIIKQRVINDYYVKLYSTRKIEVVDVRTLPVRVGLCVMINGKVKGVISRVDLPIAMNNEYVSFSVTVICPK